MSFFDDASLVMIPSGYKDQKVYSVKPTDGTGDLTFSRASGATRVGPDGLIQEVRTNSILQSQAFDNASWGKVFLTATANTTANPLNGVVNAETITLTAGTAQKYLAQVFVQNGLFTYSIYAKAGTQNFIQLMLGTDSSVFANFNISTGAVTASAGCVASVVSAGNGWYRCSMAYSTAIADNLFLLALDNGTDGRFSPTSSTGTFFLFGAQFETGDIATAYIATTTAAVSVGPVSGLPRLDYTNSTCPKLLMEPQRTNLVFFSEQLNNAGWAVDAVVTANTAVSPDGYTNADSVMETATTAFHILGDPVTTVNGTTYAYSFFAKPNGRNFARILFGNDSFVDSQSAYFNLLTGAVSASASVTASMVSYGNGWYRCTAICTSDASATSPIYFGPARNMTDGYATYAGNASLGIYAFGAQQEAGAYATSYIPTLGASVTRVADAASKTGISSLIGQTEGTLFAEFTTSGLPATDQYFFNLSDGTTTNIIYLGFYSTILVARIIDAGSLGCNINVGLAENTTYKIAFAYKANDCKLYINGVDSGTDTSVIIPAVSKFGMNEINLTAAYKVNQALLFKTRLTNAQLAELTAL
jgi:hypothetical protein